MPLARVQNRCVIYPDKIGEVFGTTVGGQPRLYKNAGVDFALAFFALDGSLQDISNIASLTLSVKALGQPATAALILKTIGAEALNPSLTADQWNAGSAQHALISVLGSETGLTAGVYDLTISGITSDNTLDPDVWGMSLLTIKDAGISNLVSPAVGDQPAASLAQITALLSGYVRYGRQPAGKTVTFVSPAGTKGITLGANDDGSLRTDQETLS